MIWIRVALWSWLWVSSFPARMQGDKDVISRYLWLAKWRSLSSTCPSSHPVMATINQAQSSQWQESSSRTTLPWCTSSPSCVYLWHAGMSTPNPHGTIIHFPCTAQTEEGLYFNSGGRALQQLYANLPLSAGMGSSLRLIPAMSQENYLTLNQMS